ncbi:MAG TPA: hypothetical protein VH415_11080 [Nitrososphaeraceae archaeon]|jgi:hypothetical protein
MNNQANKDHNYSHDRSRSRDHTNANNIGIALNDITTMNDLDTTTKLDFSHSNNDYDTTKDIGVTFASDKHLNTIDSFWFALKSGIFVRPFDFVTIEYLRHDTKTIGMIQDIQTIASNQNNFTQFDRTDQTDDFPNTMTSKRSGNNPAASDYDFQHGINIARVVVVANSEYNEEGRLSRMSTTGMPVGLGRSVRFSTKEEVTFALGVPEMIFPIPAGIIEMSNGQQIPVSLDITYLVGPDTAHVNASGISGNAKTSYLLYLLQSIYQKFKEYDQDFAMIIFNTKEKDLLQIDEIQDEEKRLTKEKHFQMLNLKMTPFDNVTYFLPRGKDGKPNSVHEPSNSKTYSYELNDVYDRLELLFSEIYDPHYNLSSIINYIYEFWPIKKPGIQNKSDKNIKTWSDLFNFKDYPDEIITHKSSLLHFQGHIQRFRRSSLFIDKKVTSTYLGKEIRKIKPGDIFVIDVAMLSTLEEQSFVIGDVMKSIDELYASKEGNSGVSNDKDNNTKESPQRKKPRYVLVFIDEINRFLPSSKPPTKLNTVGEQIVKTVNAGRTRGTILFSAQQFKSTVDQSLHESTGMHVIAKIGLSELSTASYNMIDESTKMNIVRLNKGELVIIHSAFRYPIKITFPRPSFKDR